MDFNDAGDLYRVSVETDDPVRAAEAFLRYSKDVRYVGSKEERGTKDKGNRVLCDGAVMCRCTWFGSKIGYKMRFATSEYKRNIIEKAVDARELIANGD